MNWKMFLSKLDLWTLGACALVGAVITVLSVAHLLPDTWEKAHLGAIAMALAVLAALMVGALAVRLEQISTAIAELRVQSESNTLEALSDLRKQIDPNLDVIFGDYVTEVISNMQFLIRERTLELTDIDLFRSYYKKAFEQYAGSTFYATSTPTVVFFWSGPSVLQAMATFIQRGGAIKRIFFLESEADLQKDEIRQILVSQDQIGVEVYTVLIRDVTPEFQKYVMVDSRKKIGWELFVGPGGKIRSAKLTSKPEVLENTMRTFEHLRQLDSTTRFHA